ncbi:MAG: hypothetical protein EZS28_034181 [Streblomastix strix]|uniref:Protein kinase domain-containing protein n=1 Tax=Streblomastix strix TaxID=222440 RepID=A0A5J4UK11_9EUKA|nr:MAG: hypothetical protein EZS28_034181 [Streblomastix strix]
MTTKEPVSIVVHKTTHVLDTLLDHLDESGNLDAQYFAPVLIGPNEEFFAPMKITSVFPEVRFFVVIAHLDEESNIVIEPVAEQPSPDHFALIIRHHPQDLDALRPYFEEEFQCYDDLLVQKVRDLIYIGNGPTPNGCCTIFLTSSTFTLEAAIQQGILSDLQSKFEITKSLIDSIQQAHQSGHIGFDLRPSSILCTQGLINRSIALIGFVGDGNTISKHPDHTKLRWDSDWTAPELAARNRQRRRGAAQSTQEQGSDVNGPTVASDIFSLGMILLHLFEKSNQTKELLKTAVENIPQNRCDIQQMRKQFDEFQSQIRKEEKEKRIENEKQEQERIEKEKQEQERIEKEKQEQERIEKEKQEQVVF